MANTITTVITHQAMKKNKKHLVKIIILFVTLVTAGAIGAWGQVNGTGIYYIANDNTGTRPSGSVDYNKNTPSTNWYLVPGDNPQKPHYADAWFNNQYSNDSSSSAKGDYTGDNYGDPEQPFLTTYLTNRDQAQVPDNVTVRQNNSVWIVKCTGDSIYNFIHLATGKYVVYDPPYKNAKNR